MFSRPKQQYFVPNSSGGQYGGHSYQPQFPSGPPPGTDPQLWQYFTSVDTDRSGSIDVNELQSALVNGRAFKTIYNYFFHADDESTSA